MCAAEAIRIFVIARNGDIEDLMNIVIILLVAVFWAIGGILKARANKARSEDEKEPSQRPIPPPARRIISQPSSRIQGPAGRFRSEPSHRAAPEFKPAASEKDMVSESSSKPQPPPTPPVEPSISSTADIVSDLPELEVMPTFTSGLGDLPGTYSPRHKDKKAKDTYITRFLELDDKENLRRAILYHEILSRPKSLQEPPGLPHILP